METALLLAATSHAKDKTPVKLISLKRTSSTLKTIA